MKQAVRRCCGIDVHKQNVVVCVLPPDGQTGKNAKKVYGTFTADLIRMRRWLQQLGVTEVAMESTGVFWRPVWNVLEGEFALMLANPQQVKALVGRKSDRRDCQRIAEFVQDHRLDPSFVPPREIRELRDLTRHRVALVGDRNRAGNRIEALLEEANLKLGSVVSNVFGVTGLKILSALAEGVTDAERLSWKAEGKLRKKEKQLRAAMRGTFNEHHRWLLAQYLDEWRYLTDRIQCFEQAIRTRLREHRKTMELLWTIPGVDEVSAWTLAAELGLDMTVFPDARHCASWAGLSPGEKESAGRQMSTACKKGNKYLSRAMAEAAWGAIRKKDCYLQSLFYRMRAKRGACKALVAVAHRVLVIAYQVMRDKVAYRELGVDYYDRIHAESVAGRAKARLEKLGYQVTLERVELGAEVEAVAAAPGVVKRGRGRPRKQGAADSQTVGS